MKEKITEMYCDLTLLHNDNKDNYFYIPSAGRKAQKKLAAGHGGGGDFPSY